MKIHNPNELDFDPQTLRALARGDLDPVRLAVEQHHQQKNKPAKREPKQRQTKTKSTANLPAIEKSENRVEKETKARKPAKPELKKSREERLAELKALREKRNRLARIISQCEALEVVNYETLAMKFYPEGDAVAAAKRRRDVWLLCCLFCASIVIVGWQGLLSAWVTGVVFGLLVVLLAFLLEPFRTMFYRVPTLNQLNSRRKAMEFRALNHIKMLEGGNGLVFQCQMMSAYRPALSDKRYQRLVFLSQRGYVVRAIQTVAGIRLYLSYMLEAQRAFALIKQEYMKTAGKLKNDYPDLALDSA